MLFHDSSYFQLSFIYHNHHGQKAIKYYIPNFYQIQDMFESWYKVDKKGSFFHEDKLLFYQKQLEKFLQTRVEGHGRSGCGRGGDPDLRETGTGMWSCLSALFEEILCTVSQKMKPTLLRVGFIFILPLAPLQLLCGYYLGRYREHGHLRGNRWRTVPDRSWCRL